MSQDIGSIISERVARAIVRPRKSTSPRLPLRYDPKCWSLRDLVYSVLSRITIGAILSMNFSLPGNTAIVLRRE